MATLDSLPGDQRAVLQLVLGRGRSYAEIGRLLSIEPAAVRDRAGAALDTLGPPTALDPDDRRRICDYLLGQLPDAEVAAARDRLARSPLQRAWARVISGELAPLAAGPLPEVPTAVGAPGGGEAPTASPPAGDPGAVPAEPPSAPAAEVPPEPASAPAARATFEPMSAPATEAPPPPPAAPPGPATASTPTPPPRSSRRGGVLVIAAVVIIIAAVVVLVTRHHHHAHTSVARVTRTTPARASQTSATSTTATSGSARAIAQINLTAASSAAGRAVGVAEVLQQGSEREIAIVGQHVPANTSRNAYAVWLYNSPSSAVRLGFVNPGVSANGRLSTAGRLPSDASRYRELIVTTETTGNPTTPGPILLSGTISGL